MALSALTLGGPPAPHQIAAFAAVAACVWALILMQMRRERAAG